MHIDAPERLDSSVCRQADRLGMEERCEVVKACKRTCPLVVAQVIEPNWTGCLSVFEWFRGPLLRGWPGILANRGGRGRNQSIKRQDQAVHVKYLVSKATMGGGHGILHQLCFSLCACARRCAQTEFCVSWCHRLG